MARSRMPESGNCTARSPQSSLTIPYCGPSISIKPEMRRLHELMLRRRECRPACFDTIRRLRSPHEDWRSGAKAVTRLNSPSFWAISYRTRDAVLKRWRPIFGHYQNPARMLTGAVP